jgi:hypothetical protein
MAVAQQIGPYVNRLFDDDSVREQIGDALVRGRLAYRRARDEKAAEAVRDRRLMDHLTGALGSLQGAIRSLTGEPPPTPGTRRRRTAKYLTLALAAGAVAVYLDNRAQQEPSAT